MKQPLLLYIHGFHSSPLSLKAQNIKQHCETFRPDIQVVIPQLACFPNDAKQQLVDIVESHKQNFQIALVGSSLGGYFATWLNDLYGFRTVLVNPAVKPYELLQDYLGEQTNPYTQQTYWLERQHISQLKALDIRVLQRPEQLWLLQQIGDEVLDYRQAEEKYKQSKQTVEPGGDHSFVGFNRYCAEIIDFLQL